MHKAGSKGWRSRGGCIQKGLKRERKEDATGGKLPFLLLLFFLIRLLHLFRHRLYPRLSARPLNSAPINDPRQREISPACFRPHLLLNIFLLFSLLLIILFSFHVIREIWLWLWTGEKIITLTEEIFIIDIVFDDYWVISVQLVIKKFEKIVSYHNLV